MLAIIAAILFAIAWIINATGTVTNAWFSVTGLLLIGLACLALHRQASAAPGSGAASASYFALLAANWRGAGPRQWGLPNSAERCPGEHSDAISEAR